MGLSVPNVPGTGARPSMVQRKGAVKEFTSSKVSDFGDVGEWDQLGDINLEFVFMGESSQDFANKFNNLLSFNDNSIITG